MKTFLSSVVLSFFFLMLPSPTLATSGDLAISDTNVWFGNTYFFEGIPTRIWASVQNNSPDDLLGSVRFTSKDGNIGSDQPISALAGKTDDVFVDWTPPSYGTYTVTITIIPWDGTSDNPGNNTIQKTVTVQQDTDHDGIPNSTDPDKDGDGVNNEEDAFPISSSESKDTDGDGQGNNKDTDDDNDGTPDSEDQMPEDSRYTKDQDGDGIPDETDDDIDGDDVLNSEEVKQNTDLTNPDTDGDGKDDGEDPFPADASEWSDIDGDEMGDNTDPDIDDDSIPNEEDLDPSDSAPNANIDQNIMIASLGEEVIFDASLSQDDGQIVKFIWQFGDDQVEGAEVARTFESTGLQVATLTVYDDKGQSDSIEIRVRVFDFGFLFKALGFSLLLVLLAFYIIYRYNRRALPVKRTSTTKRKKKQ